ncbi:DUF58 domain-containing protein [Numidum massiliense]|uniref:DUF58 domain-containing protein n=1 Tax=Numidum massiliense TaxID=1522315 RepID=UPI0006D57B77|nr:DUF58 domain-containing protein [Numidum massiliense]
MLRLRPFRRATGLIGVLLLLVAAFLYGKFQGGFVPWFLFYTLLTVAVYELFVYLFALKGVTVTREMTYARLHAGGELDVQLTFTRRFAFPLPWVYVKDILPEALKRSQHRAATVLFPWFKKTFTFTYVCDDLPRGRHEWHAVQLQVGDLFGFLQRQQTVAVKSEILVYPKTCEIPVWQTVNEQAAGAAIAYNRLSEDMTTVVGIRDYVNGDRLGRIHWKATARGGRLKTKEFALQQANDIVFFLDRREHAYDVERFERAVSLVASLARYAVKRRFSVGLISYGKQPFALLPQHSGGDLMQLYEHLAEVAADCPFTADRVMLQEAKRLPYGATVVFVTSQLGASTVRALSELRARRLNVTLFWVRTRRQLADSEQSRLKTVALLKVSVTFVDDDRFAEIVRGGGRSSA